MNYILTTESELYHHGVKGMKWGVRRYQNDDGTLTAAGQRRYDKGIKKQEKITKKKNRVLSRNEVLRKNTKDAAIAKRAINAEKTSKMIERNQLDRKILTDHFLTSWGKRKAQDKAFKLNARIKKLEEMDLEQQARIDTTLRGLDLNNKRIAQLDKKYAKIGKKYLNL